MLQAARVDAYNTNRKVYAEGARVCETPLQSLTSELVESGKASIHLPGSRKSRRRMFRRLNTCAVPGYAPLCMDSNDPETVSCAFSQRLLRNIPPGDKPALERFRTFVRGFVSEHLPLVTPLPFEEWLQSTSYNEARKVELRAVHDSLRGGVPTRDQCSHVDTFVKSEYYPTWKHARMINSRSDAFKVFSGPRFKAIEDAVYALPEFIKHIPVHLRPEAISSMKFAGRKYFSTDFTAFESHFTPEFLDVCECELYRHCLSNDPHVSLLCSAISGLNRMRTRTGISATVKGRRMSGDMCTSLGNGFSNLMLAKFIVSEKGGDLTGFVEGDDGIFASSVDLTEEDYRRLGFTIKIVEVDDPCTASFCGMVFSGTSQIIREPRRFLMGFGWTQSFINAGGKIMDELLRAKALSAVYETPHCPIIGAMSRYALAQTSHVHPRFVQDGFHTLPDVISVPSFSPSSDTRQLFENLYGVSIASQLAIEKAIMRGDFVTVASLLPPTLEQEEYSSKYVIVT